MTTPSPAAVPAPEATSRRRRPGASSSRIRRTTVRAAVTSGALAVLLAGGPAGAEVPSGWPDPPSIPLLDGLFIYVFAPLGLFVFITLLTIGPSLARGERLGGDRKGGGHDEWFGGRRSGVEELESGTPAPGTGGASGNW